MYKRQDLDDYDYGEDEEPAGEEDLDEDAEEEMDDEFTMDEMCIRDSVIALGAGLGIWGVINLLEGYGNDNPGAKSQGMKQLMAGGGVALIGMLLVPQLTGLFG